MVNKWKPEQRKKWAQASPVSSLAGMSAGVQDFVTINLDTLAAAFDADDKVTIATLQAKRILNLSGREARLPLKVNPMNYLM